MKVEAESILSRIQYRAEDEKRFQERKIREVQALCRQYLNANDESAVLSICEISDSLRDSWGTYAAYIDFLDSLESDDD